MLKVRSEALNKTFNMPQSFADITFKYLQDCVKNIECCEHYGIVAIVADTELADIMDSKKQHSTIASFIGVKGFEGKYDNKFIYGAPSSIFQGIDCNMPNNVLSTGHYRYFINSDSDLRMQFLNGKIFQSKVTPALIGVGSPLTGEGKTPALQTLSARNAIVVGFKIIPDNDIIGYIKGEALTNKESIKYIE